MITFITLLDIYTNHLIFDKVCYNMITVIFYTYKYYKSRFILDYLLEHKYETLNFGSKHIFNTTKSYLKYVNNNKTQKVKHLIEETVWLFVVNVMNARHITFTFLIKIIKNLFYTMTLNLIIKI